MDKNYLIDFAYRNICFFNFLEISLKNWNILNKNSKEDIAKKQSLFRKLNEENLIHYLSEEKNCRIYTVEKIQIKIDKIREWAITFNILLSKELKLEELNPFIDKTLHPTFIDKLNSIKKISNSLTQILFPQLLNNLSASLKLLNELKIVLFSKLKEETKKYNNMFLKSIEDEEANKKKLDESRSMLNKANIQFNEQKAKFEGKIKSMQEIINKLNSQITAHNNSAKKNNDDYTNLNLKYKSLFRLNSFLSTENESYTFENNSLKNENQYLKDKLNSVENDLVILKKKFEEMEKKLEKSEEQRMKAGNDLLNFVNSNHEEMVKHIKIAFNIPEKKNNI